MLRSILVARTHARADRVRGRWDMRGLEGVLGFGKRENMGTEEKEEEEREVKNWGKRERGKEENFARSKRGGGRQGGEKGR